MGDKAYHPQAGDHVEASVTLRGTVRRREDDSYFTIDYTRPSGEKTSWSFEDEEVDLGDWKFEKVTPPLPTTTGSVVRYGGVTWLLTGPVGGPKWVCSCGEYSCELAGLLGRSDVEVIYEAGEA